MEAAPGGPNSVSRLQPMWRALAHRNYRLFFSGQSISMIGTWMTRVAMSWFVFTMSTSNPELLLGLVGFVGQFPSFCLTPFAGVLVDRANRHRLLLGTQALSLVQSVLLTLVAFLCAPGMATVVLVILLALFQGVINALDMPARQAFLVEMIDRKEDLPNAIALNSSLVNGARPIGTSLAGILIVVTSVGWCFMIDALSYVAVIAALLAMHVARREREQHHTPMWEGLREGFSYVSRFAPIRAILLLLALVSFMGMPYTTLMPIFAEKVLQGKADVLGFLWAASGAGALVGALYLAARRSVIGLGRIITVATFVFGAALIGFALSRVLWLSLPFLALIGFGMMVQMAASNTILQTIVEERMRGRVMSYYTMAFVGMAPFGSLFAGVLAQWIGASYTVLIGGVACIAGSLLFAMKLSQLRSLVRPLYIRMGMLPEVAEGLQSATEMSTPPEQ